MKKYLLLLVIISSQLLIFSQESMEVLGPEIDSYILDRNPDLISKIKGFDTTNDVYPELEEYIVDKAGELIFADEYDFAKELLEVILYKNLDNEMAQELYSTVVLVVEEEKEKQRLIEEEEARIAKEKLEEEARIAKEKAEEDARIKKEEERLAKEKADEEARVEAARIAEEERIATAKAAEEEKQAIIQEHQEYIDSVENIGSDNFSYYVNAFPADFNYIKSDVHSKFNEESPHFIYGGGIAGGIFFKHPAVIINLDADVDFTLVDIVGDGVSILGVNSCFSITNPLMSIPIYGRLGYLYNYYMFADTLETDMAILNLPSAFAGVGINNLKITEDLSFSLSADYLIVSLLSDLINYGLAAEFETSCTFMEIDDLKLKVVLGVKALILNEADMFEYNINPKLGLGVTFYEK